jgi:UDP-N-acetylglucosamine 2-epimerase
MTIFGTRPEATKMAPLIKVLDACAGIESIVAVTAQHREQLDQVLDIFNIKPRYDLNIMRQRQTLADITTQALVGIERIIKEAKPHVVLVHGDTTTTLAASLAAYYNQAKLGHVEAGLRTYDKYQPFPEEINRRVTSVLADYHFAPTNAAKENLIKENILANNIHVTGNTAIDCLKYTLRAEYTFGESALNELDFCKRVIVVTAHRRENLGEPLRNICRAIRRLADRYHDIAIVYPVHLNPTVREVVFDSLANHPRIVLTDPLDIMDMHNLLDRSYLVLTDSGGLQEEVPSMGKPVLVLRNVTERPEAVAAGTVDLVGTDEERVFTAARALLDDAQRYKTMASANNPYGDGFASERIRDILLGAQSL